MTRHSDEVLSQLQEKLEQRTAVIGVIGLGYVGLPLTQTLHTSGYPVIGFDTDDAKVRSLRAGESYIGHVGKASVRALASSSRFTASSLFADLSRCDVCIICLPTPVGAHNEPDMSFVTSATERLAKETLHRGVLIVLESTTYPGATDGEIVELLQASGLRCGEDFFVAFSPEREDPGNTRFTTTQIPKLVGGVDAASGRLAALLYERGGFAKVELVSCARVAECAKLLENSYRAVNIALVNELKGVFRTMGVDIWEVLDAAATKPFGFQRFDPGPGIGGHCIPVDPLYLAWKARETGAACSLIETAAAVNAGMPGRVVGRVQWALNGRGRAVRGARALLVGVAYKGGVDDVRCAPALEVWAGLGALGARVAFTDPHVPALCATRRHAALAGQRSAEFSADALRRARYDVVVVLTHHAAFGRYDALAGFAGPVVDTRNCVPRDAGLDVVPA